MLFTYQYVPHQLDKMQEFLDFIFYKVWCVAQGKSYDLELFEANPELYEMMKALHYSDTEYGDLFATTIERVFEIFKSLTPHQIKHLKKWYLANNEIEKLCRKEKDLDPITYKELDLFNPDLKQELKKLFGNLYTHIISVAAIKDKVGQIEDHYQQFVTLNAMGKCPFCGIADIKGIHHSKREAYDHYLPKGTYPFNSINFKNLAPMCHTCNSSYKLVADPLFDKQNNRRKAFYIYANQQPDLKIKLTLKHNCIDQLSSDDIELIIESDTCGEEVQTWMDVFGIEERYKAKCLSDSDGKYWTTQIQDECQNYEMEPLAFLSIKIREAESYPFSDTNFLRKPFLEACKQAGVFGTMDN
ncbi:hypothetical protein KJ966_19630 [bacterium]|nr:hypothetical protein [bacterium]